MCNKTASSQSPSNSSPSSSQSPPIMNSASPVSSFFIKDILSANNHHHLAHPLHPFHPIHPHHHHPHGQSHFNLNNLHLLPHPLPTSHHHPSINLPHPLSFPLNKQQPHQHQHQHLNYIQPSSSPSPGIADSEDENDYYDSDDAASDRSFSGDKGDSKMELKMQKKQRKARTAFTDHQLQTLEKSFERAKYLSVQDRMELATKLNLSDTQVKTWYQNRRTKWKRQSAVGLELLAEAGNYAAVQRMLQSSPYWMNQIANYASGLPRPSPASPAAMLPYELFCHSAATGPLPKSMTTPIPGIPSPQSVPSTGASLYHPGFMFSSSSASPSPSSSSSPPGHHLFQTSSSPSASSSSSLSSLPNP